MQRKGLTFPITPQQAHSVFIKAFDVIIEKNKHLNFKLRFPTLLL